MRRSKSLGTYLLKFLNLIKDLVEHLNAVCYMMSLSSALLCLFQKTPQIMYLEQELESLKAVLEIKNEKLHQQDVKLMKMEKLVCFFESLAP